MDTVKRWLYGIFVLHQMLSALAQIDCGEPELPMNGGSDSIIEFSNTTENSVALYFCGEGYTTLNITETQCGADGKWTVPPPTCKPIECGFPEQPIGGAADSSVTVDEGVTVGAVASYTCGYGYTTDDPLVRRCGEQGLWTGQAPRCRLMDCGPPLPPMLRSDSFELTVSNVTSNKFVVYTCNYGFTSDDPMTRFCGFGGIWGGSIPKCERVACQDLPVPTFGAVVYAPLYESPRFGSKAVYSCIHGYQMKSDGSEERSCEADGMWSGVQPVCENIDECASSPCGHHGNCSDLIASFSCTCHSGWQGLLCQLPVDSCDDEPCGLHGTCRNILGGGYTCACQPGYSGVNCDVAAFCGEPPKPISKALDATVSPDKLTLGGVATYTCGQGWSTHDPLTRHCMANDSWSGKTPTCKRIDCGVPGKASGSDQASLHFEETFYDAEVLYECGYGYTTEDATSATCQHDGQWKPLPPKCRIVDCGVPKASPNVRMKYTTTTYKGLATFSCNDGYSLVGVAEITCTAEGHWSEEEPHCLVLSCGEPEAAVSSAVDAYVSWSGLTQGFTATYQCGSGYTTSDPITRVCQPSGWSGHPPICEPVHCPTLGSLQWGKITYSSSGLPMYGTKAHYTCHRGYKVSGGESPRECGAQGVWKGSDPKCINIDDCDEVSCFRGKCIDRLLGFNCSCDHGWKGERCQTEADTCADEPCVSGSCVDPRGKYSCICDQGWAGVNCEIPHDCGMPGQIANAVYTGGGTSLGSLLTVTCDTGYSVFGEAALLCSPLGWRPVNRPSCKKRSDEGPCLDSPCGDHGVCFESGAKFICQCHEGWSGSNCKVQVDDCSSAPCVYGVCQNGVNSYICTCDEGYTGLMCDQELKLDPPNLCAGVSCSEHGQCVSEDNVARCVCQPQYTGPNCGVDLDACASSPCVTGVCQSLNNYFKCDCEPGFSGELCEFNKGSLIAGANDGNPARNGEKEDGEGMPGWAVFLTVAAALGVLVAIAVTAWYGRRMRLSRNQENTTEFGLAPPSAQSDTPQTPTNQPNALPEFAAGYSNPYLSPAPVSYIEPYVPRQGSPLAIPQRYNSYGSAASTHSSVSRSQRTSISKSSRSSGTRSRTPLSKSSRSSGVRSKTPRSRSPMSSGTRSKTSVSKSSMSSALRSTTPEQAGTSGRSSVVTRSTDVSSHL